MGCRKNRFFLSTGKNTIQLYEYVKNEYEKKLSTEVDSSVHFEIMFEATIDGF